MTLRQIDRMSAILLAKTIADRKELLDLKGELEVYVARLASHRMFSVGEIADISGLSDYQVRRTVSPPVLIRARSGVLPRHLDHLLRMVDDNKFAKVHARTLVQDGATVAALSRVTGLSETSLRRWAREEDDDA